MKKKKSAKAKPMLKKPAKEKLPLQNFKASKDEMKVIRANAKKFAGGNVSLWLRHSAMNYVPKRKDLSL